MNANEPLAYRMSPKTLDDYIGQEHILGKDKILYRTIKADRLSSIILWGPPGCGKTSLARVISNTTKYKFAKLNAVTAGVGDIKNAIEEAKNPLLKVTAKTLSLYLFFNSLLAINHQFLYMLLHLIQITHYLYLIQSRLSFLSFLLSFCLYLMGQLFHSHFYLKMLF